MGGKESVNFEFDDYMVW